jgi:hypothetical protein
MKDQVTQLITELDEADKLALIRCEAGKPFANCGQLYRSKKLQDLELVEKTAWRCTELGNKVVAHMCGVPYKAPQRVPDKAPTPRPADAKKLVLKENQEALPAFAQRAAVCTGCKGDIPKDDPCLWVQDKGIFHEDCVEAAA